MNQVIKRFFALFLSVLLVLPSVAVTTVSAASQARSVNIYTLEGKVSIKRGGDKELKAFEGMRLESGDTIITGLDSSAVISIDSDKTITVDENTEITLDEISGTEKKGRTGTSVFLGNIINNVKEKLTEGSSYETRTSNAVMGVRGTSYLVSKRFDYVKLLVSSGTVAMQQNEPMQQEGSEPLMVEKGFAAQSTGLEKAQAASAIRAEDLLSLTPSAAKVFVTEELFSAVPDKTDGMSTIDDFVLLLEQQQTENHQQVQQKMEQKNAEITSFRQQEPVPFFSEPANVITGEANEQMISARHEVSLPAVAKISEERSRPSPVNLPVTSPPSQPVPENPTAAAPKVPQPDTKLPETTAPLPKEETKATESTQEDNLHKPGGNKPGDNNSDDNSSDDNNDNNPSNPSKPEPSKPEVSVNGLSQEAVYIENKNGELANFFELAVQWKDSAQAKDVILEIQEADQSYSPFIPSRPIETVSGTSRLYLSKGEKVRLHGRVLKITPKVGTDKIAVASKITLDFNLPPSQKIKKLCPVDKESIYAYNTDNNITVSFVPVKHNQAYEIQVYLGTSEKPEYKEVITASGDGSSLYTFPKNSYSGTFHVTLQALGNNSDILSSEITASVEFQTSNYSRLETPVGKVLMKQDGTGIVLCSLVKFSRGYELEFSDGTDVNIVDAGYPSLPDGFLYQLTIEEVNSTVKVRVRALSGIEGMEDSDWGVLDIVYLENRQKDSMTSKVNVKDSIPKASDSNAAASPSDASMWESDSVSEEDENEVEEIYEDIEILSHMYYKKED